MAMSSDSNDNEQVELKHVGWSMWAQMGFPVVYIRQN